VKVRIKARVRTDLLAIRSWSLSHWGEQRARDFLEGLIESIERLAEFPQIGRSRSAFAPGLRSIRYQGYVVFYSVDADGPVIVAVLHERRNHAALGFADLIEGE